MMNKVEPVRYYEAFMVFDHFVGKYIKNVTSYLTRFTFCAIMDFLSPSRDVSKKNPFYYQSVIREDRTQNF